MRFIPTLDVRIEQADVERALLDYVELLKKQDEFNGLVRDTIRPVRGWLEEAGREPWDGPRDDLDTLLSRLNLIEEFIPESQSPTSVDILQAFTYTLTGSDQLLVGRILSILDSEGPLHTDAVLSRIPNRSETRVKTLLSQLAKIDVIHNGSDGYFRNRGSEDHSKAK